MKKLLLALIIVSPLFLAGCNTAEQQNFNSTQSTVDQLEKRDKMTKQTENTSSKSY